jgi:hypothetical protein
MRKSSSISPYMRRPLAIYDFATAPFWISLYMRKILFSFLSVYCCKDKVISILRQWQKFRYQAAGVEETIHVN